MDDRQCFNAKRIEIAERVELLDAEIKILGISSG
jgi:hypothetical protein